jgi:NADH-quinone oxidoreductase subunit J
VNLDLQAVSMGEKVIFAILAGAILAGALMTVTRRNPVTAVMSLVGTFFALACMYATMSAHFLAILQVLVYAGAIMVLFIFVVMILNRDEIEPVSFRGIITRAGGVVIGGIFMAKLARLAWAFRGEGVLAGGTGPASPTFGTVADVGASLFKDFVYPFEAISVLLLVAIVGGVVVSRSHRQEEEAEETARQQARIRASIRPETRVGPDGAPATGHEAAPAHHAHH